MDPELLWLWLRPVAAAPAGSCSSNLTSSLGISICCRCSLKKKKEKKKRKRNKMVSFKDVSMAMKRKYKSYLPPILCSIRVGVGNNTLAIKEGGWENRT